MVTVPRQRRGTPPIPRSRRSLLGRFAVLTFVIDTTKYALRGGRSYYAWMTVLGAVMAFGGYAYTEQARHGLSVTGMNDHVSWGLYISNFTFLVGVAAAAVMLVLPTYIIKDVDFRNAVLIGEGTAVGALIMCLAFVTVDLGGPERFWHLIPGIGRFNWPTSLLSWDIIVLNGYLALNVGIPFYLLFQKYRDRPANKRAYVPFVVLSVFWAVSIHMVTAFLYASQPARPFWNNALLGPRFLASAFCAGPALIILILYFIRTHSAYEVKDETFRKLALIITGAAQINLIMLFSELFKEFYHPTQHSASAVYLFFGLHGHNALVPWIWPALIANVSCTIVLTLNPLRRRMAVLLPTCAVLFTAVWVEKGMGLIVPGFTPSPLGEVAEYFPSWVEIAITLGIWALGISIVTVLVRTAIAIELGEVVYDRPRYFVPRAYEPRTFYKPSTDLPFKLKKFKPRMPSYGIKRPPWEQG